MEIGIDEVTLGEATKCMKAFTCLDDPVNTCCEVVRVFHDLVYYVRCTHDDSCSYETHFGELSSCSCPIRKRIYDRYKM